MYSAYDNYQSSRIISDQLQNRSTMPCTFVTLAVPSGPFLAATVYSFIAWFRCFQIFCHPVVSFVLIMICTNYAENVMLFSKSAVLKTCLFCKDFTTMLSMLCIHRFTLNCFSLLVGYLIGIDLFPAIIILNINNLLILIVLSLTYSAILHRD